MVIKSEKSQLGLKNVDTTSNSVVRQAMPQVLAASVKNVLLLGFGMTLGFPTILIPSFSNPSVKESFSLGQEEISWIGSVNLICVPVGCLLSGAVTQAIGRKRAMQLNNIPFLAAWLLFKYSTSVWQVFLALCITGLNGGLLEAPVLTYVAEITQPHLRGMLSSTSTMSVILGVLIQFLLGSFLHWRTVALVNCIIPVTSFVLLFFVPESPHWLIMKNRLLDARKSIAWLRGWTTLDEIEPEFKELCRHLQKNSKEGIDNPAFDGNEVYSSTNNNTKDAVGFVRSKLESLKLLAKKNFVFPYLLVSFSFFLGHFSGMTTLQTYAVQIFATLKTPIDKYYATIILGVAELAGCIGCVSLIHYTGKRPLTFLSMITCSLCFFIVATYAYISDIHYLETSRVNKTTNNVTTVDLMYQEDAEVNLNWIPTTFLIASAFLSHIGIRILPWILTGEVYTNETRAAASGLSSGISYIFGFLANKVFLKMISTITLPGTFWFYSCVGLMGTLVLYFALPETEGKSLHEITEHFSGKKKLDNKVHRKRKVFGGEANHGYANTENGFRNNTPSDAESHL